MTTILTRFEAKIDKRGPRARHAVTGVPLGACWIWTAARNAGGYGVFRVRTGAMRQAHLVAMMLAGVTVPPGFQVDHACRNRACVRTDHLEVVTPAENVRRGDAGKLHTAKQRAKTHCPAGHPYAGDNVYVKTTGARGCRECGRRASREYARRQRRA